MEKILTIDEHDYDDNSGEIFRVSIRGIIFIGSKLLLIEDSAGGVKLPGGGMEPGEDDYQALAREIKEETGYEVIPESVKPFGEIEEKRLSVKEPRIWHQINRLYFCDVYPGQGQCGYSENERKYGFHQVFYTIDEALEKNKKMLEHGLENPLPTCAVAKSSSGMPEDKARNAWTRREYETLLLIKSWRTGKDAADSANRCGKIC